MIEKVTGLAELHRVLQQLPVKVEKNILRGMIRAACKPVVDVARALAPMLKEADPRRVPGALRRSIRTMSTAARGAEIKGGVAAGGRARLKGSDADAFYASFVEYGTVNTPPKPFMRPAADSQADAALEAAAAYVRDRLEAGDLR